MADKQKEWADNLHIIAANLRQIINRAESEDRPYARDPLIQAIKAFSNEIDIWVNKEVKSRGQVND